MSWKTMGVLSSSCSRSWMLLHPRRDVVGVVALLLGALVLVYWSTSLAPLLHHTSPGTEGGKARGVEGAAEDNWWRKLFCSTHERQRAIVLPRIERDVTPNGSDYNIFLFETGCNTRALYRAMCSVESWAKENPGAKVWYIMTSLEAEDKDGLLTDLKERYPNLNLVGIDLDHSFSKTPLYKVFQARKWALESPFPKINLSDLLRNVALWLWGGFHADTDTICLRSVTQLRNAIAFQGSQINNALMHFDAGHDFIHRTMIHLAQNFKPAVWAANGPKAASAVLSAYCNATIPALKERGARSCSGVRLLLLDEIQGVPWQKWGDLFSDNNREDFQNRFGKVFALHMWNKLSKGTPVRLGQHSAYELAARDHCPVTFARASARSLFF